MLLPGLGLFVLVMGTSFATLCIACWLSPTFKAETKTALRESFFVYFEPIMTVWWMISWIFKCPLWAYESLRRWIDGVRARGRVRAAREQEKDRFYEQLSKQPELLGEVRKKLEGLSDDALGVHRQTDEEAIDAALNAGEKTIAVKVAGPLVEMGGDPVSSRKGHGDGHDQETP